MKTFRLIKESSSSTSLKSSPISSRTYSDHPACHFRKFGYPKKSDNFGIRLHWRHERTFLGIFLQGSSTLAARGSILANMRYLAQKGDCHDQAETECKKNPQVLAGGSKLGRSGQDRQIHEEPLLGDGVSRRGQTGIGKIAEIHERGRPYCHQVYRVRT